jgi:putative transposase
MDVSDAKRLKALEAENSRLKKLLAEALHEGERYEVALPGVRSRGAGPIRISQVLP